MWTSTTTVATSEVLIAGVKPVGAATCRLKRVLSLRGNPAVMKSSIQIIENIIRAKTALHLKLVAHRNSGKVDIGGGRIEDLVAQVDAGISSYERMLVRFKDELAAKAMSSTNEGAQQACERPEASQN
jgi:hypothetical protein